MTVKRKTQKNIIPFYAQDLTHLSALYGQHLTAKEMTQLFNCILNFIKSDELTQWNIFRGQKAKDEINDKIATTLLHLHNHIFQFLPFDFPQQFISILLDLNQNKIDLDAFTEIKSIQTLDKPMTYAALFQLIFLLRLQKRTFIRLFSDGLSDEEKAYFQLQENPREDQDSAKECYILRQGICHYSKAVRRFIPNFTFKTAFPLNKQGKRTCAFNQIDLPPYYLTPYLSLRLWYIMGKTFGAFNVNEVRGLISSLPQQADLRYQQLIEHYLKTR